MPKESVQLDTAKDTEPPAYEAPAWHEYKLRSLAVSVAAIAGKYVRVQELGGGYNAVEVEGLEPFVTEDPFAVCLLVGEKSAYAGKLMRRYTEVSGEDVFR